jgi:hypothetical protein
MATPTRFTELCADLLCTGVAVRFTARGPSMAPTIRDGEVVTVEPVRPHDVAAGDVVFYAGRRGLTAHRVVSRLRGPEPAFLARGDAPGSTEELVLGGQVLGRVRQVERRGRATDVAPRPWAARIALGLGVRAALRRLAARARRLGAAGRRGSGRGQDVRKQVIVPIRGHARPTAKVP